MTRSLNLFPYLPQRPAYNKRLRPAAPTMQHIIAALARDCPSWHDDLWLVDSTPVECGRLTGAKTDERDTALAMIHLDPTLDDRPGQVLMADKGYRSATFEAELNARNITLIRPAIAGRRASRMADANHLSRETGVGRACWSALLRWNHVAFRARR